MLRARERLDRPSRSYGSASRTKRLQPPCRHLLRKRWSQFRRNNERHTDHDKKEGKELSASKAGDEGRVRFPEIFEHDSENRVANEEQTGQDAVRLAGPGADIPEDGEKHDALEKGFVDLRRVPRSQHHAQDVL